MACARRVQSHLLTATPRRLPTAACFCSCATAAFPQKATSQRHSPLRASLPTKTPTAAAATSSYFSTTCSTSRSFSSIPLPSSRQRKPTRNLVRKAPSAMRHCSCGRREMRDDLSAAASVQQGREVLPKNVKPQHYHLTLEPDLEKHTYAGSVNIDLDVVDTSSTITLNTLELQITQAEVHGPSGIVSKSPKLLQNEEAQTTTFSFDDKLPAGSKATLRLNFTGILNDSMAGFYRSSYTAADGSKKFMATTQMEPTDARRAIPCFDEPALKAQFSVTLVADHHLTCLGNMDVKSEKEVISALTGAKKKAVSFNTTPLMSTYLLAFIVGELEFVESTKHRVPVRVYAPPDQDMERGKFAVELAAETLAFYEKKFDSEFPLPKMDMVAIPDFSAGAMENWGLVTYRVVDLLFDEKTSGASTKRRVADVVQHELAHQWFGNLVTMDFWEGLWLNEGFATWMSWYAANSFFPEWKVWQSYVTDDLAGALSLDSLRSSHPVEVPIRRADEINQIFDAISYSKGSCILRMIARFLGEETFLSGVRLYLKRHAYGNTTTNDLWNALSEASGKDVAKIMNIWTRHVGYPVLTVTEDEKAGTIRLRQNRFLKTADVKPEEDKILYPVFLGMRTKDGVNEELTLLEREGEFKLPADDFFKFNADHSGTYRTFYTSSRLEKLGKAAREGRLSTEDRTGMIADAGALSSSGYQPTSGTLSLLKSFGNESEYVVWDQITTWIASLRAAWNFESEETRSALRKFQRDLTAPLAHKLGWTFTPGEDHLKSQFKALMFSSAGLSGDKKVVEAAFDMFGKFSDGDSEAINANIRGAVFGICLQNGADIEYACILEAFRHAKTADERNTALRSLGRAKSPENIMRTLKLAMSDEVRNQDIYMPLGGLRAHAEGISALWEWTKSNWEVLSKRLPPGGTMLSAVVSLSTSGLTHDDQLKDIEKFFASKETKGFDQSLAQSIDSIKAKNQWINRDGKDIEKWLGQNGYLG